MNKMLLYTLFLSLGTVHSGQAMEKIGAAQINQQPELQLKNLSGEKVLFTYQATNKPAIALTLDNNEEIRLSNILDTLETLYIEPYGKLKGWLSVSALTGGYVKSTNLAELDKVKRARKAKQSIRISIKPTGQESILGRVVSTVAPYSYEVETITVQKAPGSQLVTLLEQFPQTLKAFEQQKPILARYVLSVPEKADMKTIEAAYERLFSQLRPKIQSSTDDETRLAKKVIELAEQAKLNLLGEKNSFDQLIAEELDPSKPKELYAIPKTTVEATAIDSLLGMDITDISQLSEEEREKMREMGFVFKGDPGYPE